MNILTIVLLILGVYSPSIEFGNVDSGFGEWPSVMVNGHEGVVVPRDEAESMVWSEDPITGYWLPGEDWLSRAEDAVLRKTATATDENRQPNINGYRQYAGYIVDGERKIFINSMCTSFDGWKSNGILVMDGGPCFWTADYNADTDQIESLIVNGQA